MRLIDADALLNEIDRIYKDHYINSCYQFIHDFFRAMFRRILKAPTIDPANLRTKGEWIYNTDDFTPKKRCTNCGYNKPLVAGEAIKQEPDNYCPNCGADMRGNPHDS